MIFWWWLLKEEIMFTWTIIETLLSLKKENFVKRWKGCQIKPFSKNECILGIDRWDKFYGTLLYMNECINCIATLVPKPFMAKKCRRMIWNDSQFYFFVKTYIAYSIYMPKILHIVCLLRYCNNARIHVLDYTI